jgi:CubicO group peptidase (beta-lactamase class C family)
MIIERASAQTYEQFLRDTFITPMGLGSTSSCGEMAPPPRGYRASPGGPVTLDSVADPSLTWAAGGICSTASDLVRWNTALVASPLHARMIGDRVQEFPGVDYGYGLGIDTFEGRVRVWHSGGQPGFTSRLMWFPEEQISVAVLMNITDQGRDRVGEVANALARSLFVENGAAGAGSYSGTAGFSGESGAGPRLRSPAARARNDATPAATRPAAR